MSNMSRWYYANVTEKHYDDCGFGYRDNARLEDDTSSGGVSPELWEEYCMLQRYATKGSLDWCLNSDWTQPDRLRSA